MWNSGAVWRSYEETIGRRKIPEQGSPLIPWLRKNPKLCPSDIVDGQFRHSSMVYRALAFGHFAISDFILKENGKFVPGADPWYCGKKKANHDCWVSSSCINFYMALLTLEFYAADRKKGMTELLELNKKDPSQILHVKKTHYDLLYGMEDGQRVGVDLFPQRELNNSAKEVCQKDIAPWFMRRAYPIFCLENKLTATRSASEKAIINTELLQLYWCIAVMETTDHDAFNYFLDKALNCFQQSSLKDNQKYIQQFSQYDQHRRLIFDYQNEQWKSHLPIEPHTNQPNFNHFRSLEAWERAYENAVETQYIIEDGVVHRDLVAPERNLLAELPEGETDSERHSSGEKNSSIIQFTGNPYYNFWKQGIDAMQDLLIAPSKSADDDRGCSHEKKCN